MNTKVLTKDDLDELALGTTVLGSGGGGDPAYDLLLARYFTDKHGPVALVSVEEVDDDALVVPVGFMGAPSVVTEMLTHGAEFDPLFERIEAHYKKRIGAVMATEIGGSNGLVPISCAVRKGLPVIDGDTLGRAFPELQMSSCTLFGVSPAPCFLGDSLGNIEVLYAENSKEVEEKARTICSEMGSSAAVCLYIMDGRQAKQAVLRGTVTKAMALGKLVKARRREELIKEYTMQFINRGIVIDLEMKIDDGFLSGKIVLECVQERIEVLFQNEYLIARGRDGVKAVTPDIICLFEEEQFTPLTVEQVAYGMQVELVSFPSPSIWKTPEGMSLVGPKVFGYSEV